MYNVMLAQTYKPNKVYYPCIVQPKLDGIRCRAVVTDDKVELFTRDNKTITSLVHIESELKTLPPGNYDGEIYTHLLPFANISGIARRHTADDESSRLNYVIYDMVGRLDPYLTTYQYLQVLIHQHNFKHVQIIDQYICKDEEQLDKYHAQFIQDKYEGSMIRTKVFNKKDKVWEDKPYESQALNGVRRSWSLLKKKDFSDGEFEIIGFEEEMDLAGNPKGRTGAVLLRTSTGKGFAASGLSDTFKADSWSDQAKFIGKLATIKYFEISPEGIPRFPSFVSVRWDDETPT